MKQSITVNEAHGILSEMQSDLDKEHLLEIEEMLKAEQEHDDT
tara:strand:- start:129130 stop:129258 length:129 start_codon:yes stop_codon:yes gene_type:complete